MLAYIPLIAIAVVFVLFCLFDLFRSMNAVRWFPKWVWAVIIVISVPLGGIVYLVIGKRI